MVALLLISVELQLLYVSNDLVPCHSKEQCVQEARSSEKGGSPRGPGTPATAACAGMNALNTREYREGIVSTIFSSGRSRIRVRSERTMYANDAGPGKLKPTHVTASKGSRGGVPRSNGTRALRG